MFTLPHLLFHFPNLPKVHCLFTLRDDTMDPDDPLAGGNLSFQVGDDEKRVKEVRSALSSLCAPLGLTEIFEVRQVHGTRLLTCKDRPDPSEEADGLATSRAGCGLLIKTADCQCILVTNRTGSAIMALHVGWRGNASEFIPKAIHQFCAFSGNRAQELFAVRGPSLGPLKAQFLNFEQEWPDRFRTFLDEKTRTMDLWALSRSQLEASGIPSRQISGLDLCTMSNPNCFSYRRSKRCGRLGGMIWREEP